MCLQNCQLTANFLNLVPQVNGNKRHTRAHFALSYGLSDGKYIGLYSAPMAPHRLLSLKIFRRPFLKKSEKIRYTWWVKKGDHFRTS